MQRRPNVGLPKLSMPRVPRPDSPGVKSFLRLGQWVEEQSSKLLAEADAPALHSLTITSTHNFIVCESRRLINSAAAVLAVWPYALGILWPRAGPGPGPRSHGPGHQTRNRRPLD